MREIPPISTRRLILWTLGVTAVFGAFWLIIRFDYMIPLLLAAIILSTAIRPGMLWLEKRGVAKPVGILLIYGTVGLLLALLIWYAIPILGAQSAAVGQSLAEGYAMLRAQLDQIPNIMAQRLLLALPPDLSALLPGAAAGGESLTDAAMPAPASQGQQLLNGFFQLIAIFALTFYWTLEGPFVKQSLFLLAPLPQRERIRGLVGDMEAKVSAYLLGQGILCLVIGGMAFIAYLLIGLPNALLLAIFAGLLEAVPIIGPFLGAVPAMVVGLSISPAAALWVAAATAVIQQLENSYLVPRVMRDAIGIRPLVTLLVLLGFGAVFGVLGALIALPLAAVLQLLLDRYLLAADESEIAQPERDRLSVLRYETNQLVQDVRGQFRKKDAEPSAMADAIEDELEAIVLDLEGYLAAPQENRA